MRSFGSESNNLYVDHLAHALRHFECAVGDGGAYDSIGVFGVESVVAKPLNEVVCEEGVEA